MRRRIGFALLIIALMSAAAGNGSAAIAITTNCAGFQAALNTAAADPGSTVTLTEVCQDENFFLENTAGDLTIRGTQGMLAGFDNEGFGGGPENVQRPLTIEELGGDLAIRDLLFRNTAGAASGGGLFVDAEGSHDVELTRLVFENNSVSSGAGGGAWVDVGDTGHITVFANSFLDNSSASVYGGGALLAAHTVTIDQSVFNGNHARFSGGGAAVFTTDLASFTENAFNTNSTTSDGGGLAVYARVTDENAEGVSAPGDVTVRLSDNRFNGNAATPSEESTFGTRGGGLFVTGIDDEGAEASVLVESVRNDFTLNIAGPGGGGETDSSGGGAWIEGNVLLSEDDRYFRNTVFANVLSESRALGGGLGFRSVAAGDDTSASMVAINLAVAANEIAVPQSVLDPLCETIDCNAGPVAFGLGAGVYVDGVLPTSVTLGNATLTHNGFGFGVFGTGRDITGDSDDVDDRQLAVINSIVYTRGDGTEYAGWGTVNALHSDICSTDGQPLAGPGNICTDPLLVDPANVDVHQTAESPTVDTGNNLQAPTNQFDFDRESSPAPDSPRQARIQDGDDVAGAVIDMGADELPGAGPTCPGDPNCEEGPPGDPTCNDNVDNDGDGEPDEQDPDCQEEEGPKGDPTCNDGIDNDGDGETDDEDTDCVDVGGGGTDLPPTGVGSRTLLGLMMLGGAAALLLLRRRKVG